MVMVMVSFWVRVRVRFRVKVRNRASRSHIRPSQPMPVGYVLQSQLINLYCFRNKILTLHYIERPII